MTVQATQGDPRLFIVVVVLALSFVVVSNVFEYSVEAEGGIAGRMVRTGWDICVFSFGIAVGILTNDRVAGYYEKSDGGIWLAVVIVGCLLWCLACMAFIMALRKKNPTTLFRGIVCVGIGGISMVPSLVCQARALGLPMQALVRRFMR